MTLRSLRTRCPALFIVALAAVMLTASLPVDRSHAAARDAITAETLTAEQVVKAIDALVEAIYDRRHPTRYWEPPVGRGDGSQYQTGGHTALAVLALLHAGESYQNERLQEPIEHLKDLELEGTYAVSVRASLWARLPPRFQEHLERDIKWLRDGFSTEVGGWTYYKLPTTTVRDNSLRQFGALAWWDGAKRGSTIPRSYWESLENGYLDMQLADGGWDYRGRTANSTGSMTAAGLGTLFITQELLHARESVPLNRGSRSRAERAIENGLAWLNENFSPTQNPNRDDYFYYYLYGVERVGLASGYKYFGGRDWYREGAAELIRRFCRWDPDARRMIMHERAFGDGRRREFRVEDLAFGLMFLSRGYVPSVINKLQDHSTAWNNRPRDVANLTYWLGQQTARNLMWQITDINAPAEEWLDAPAMYYASHQPIPWLTAARINVGRFVTEQRERLAREVRGDVPAGAPNVHLPDVPQMKTIREYIDRGGLLIAVNEGSGRAFAESVEDLGRVLYPLFDWQTAPADHWAYTLHRNVDSHRPRIRVLSNGVRDLMLVLTDGDVSATLQGRDFQRRGHYDTISNIYFYASEMNRPRPRLASIDADRFAMNDVEPAGGRSATVVRAMHEGNWNPEPGALPHFASILRRRGDLNLSIIDHPLRAIHLFSPPPNVVLVNGIEAHDFTEEERHAIRQYIEEGGIILFETPGGMGRFTASAEQMVAGLFSAPIRPLNRHRVITGEGLAQGSSLTEVEYRPFTVQLVGLRETTPRLRGLHFAGRPRVFFSRDDLSHALLNQPCWGVNGYSTDAAQRMMRNIVLYALDIESEG